MATLVENAIRIKQTFDDIYDAIVEKGVTPSGGVDTYSSAIDEIDTSSIITPSQVIVGVSQAYGTANNVSFNSSTDFLINFSYTISSASYFSYNSTSKELTCAKSGVCIGELGVYKSSSTGMDTAQRYVLICKNGVEVLRVLTPTNASNYATLGVNLLRVNAGDKITIVGSGSSKQWYYTLRSAFYYIA